MIVHDLRPPPCVMRSARLSAAGGTCAGRPSTRVASSCCLYPRGVLDLLLSDTPWGYTGGRDMNVWEAVVSAIGRSLYEGFAMFWETLWALVLGFALAGAVQAFISRGRMQRA